jgi:hypothetical protein
MFRLVHFHLSCLKTNLTKFLVVIKSKTVLFEVRNLSLSKIDQRNVRSISVAYVTMEYRTDTSILS